MDVVRRVYLYVIAAASLGMLVVGLCNLGAALIDLGSGTAIERSARESIATAGALVLVGLPIWALHWTIANRAARTSSADRASALRRLYLYGSSGALLIAWVVLGNSILEQLLNALAHVDPRWDAVRLARDLWQVAVVGAIWTYQLRWAATDRANVGEHGASATVRRWYVYATLLLATLTLLFASRDLVRTIALYVADPDQFVRESVTIATIAHALIALLVWVIHQRLIADAGILAEDRRSTLRAVTGFWVLGVCVCLTLVDASQLLYFGLAHALGVPRPGGIEGDIGRALINPASTILVFGAGWALTRYRLDRDAAPELTSDAPEASRQIGVRRLYMHLVALAALATLSAGLAGVLWTLSDRLLGVQAPIPEQWRDQVSLSLTMIIVGLVAWVGHWRPAPALVERLALSRRLYLFAALLGAVLVLLGSGATFVYALLGQLIGAPGATTATVGRAFAASLVAAGVGAYHFRVLRQDLAVRRTQIASAPPAEPQAQNAGPIVVEIVGASEEQIREALAALPRDASYGFRAIDRPAGAD